jgi:hypothetical protein
MANQDRANQNPDGDKAEGERWSSEDDTVRKADRDQHPEQLYDGEDSDNAGGITNRPLEEEIGNQQELPGRGTSRDSRGNPNATRSQGHYTEDER